MGRRMLLVAGLLCLFAMEASSQDTTGSGSDSGSGSGSASASGSGVGSADCASAGCSHSCVDTAMGPMCMCPNGYQLSSDTTNCEACPGGRWGQGCESECNCQQGNPCDRFDGTCICNSCWSGTNCFDAVGSDCFLEFLREPVKIASSLRERYGGAAIPLPPDDTTPSLVASTLLEVDANLINNVNLEILDRTDVGQGPLAKITFTVDFNFDRPGATAGLDLVENKVKIGDVRATLITQRMEDRAEVTINAGTSEGP